MTPEASPPEANPAPALVGAVVAGRYRVDRLLGTGGMGAVYLAEHVLMHKTVALKVLHREMTVHPEIVARFEREAVAAARIDHPNVATAMDFGRLDDGSCYLVLEYVDGRSLRDLVAEGPVEPPRALHIARQIAQALAAAHAAGIVHRDLKPDNVMLVPQPDGTDLVKVLDFGIAKLDGAGDDPASGRQLTRIGTVIGTAGYMAPEQALGQSVDHRADLYAFGVVLYEMLSGRLPFHAEEVTQILAKQLTERPAPLPEGTSPDLAALTLRLLEKTADERLQTTADLVEWLDRARIAPATGAELPVSAVPVAPASASLPTARTAFGVDTGAPDPAAGVPLSRDVPPGRRRAGLLAVLAVVLLATVSLWKARAPDPAVTPSASPSVAASIGGVVPAGAPAAAPTEGVASAVPGPVPPASAASSAPSPTPKVVEATHDTVTETTTTSQANGRTTRTTRRTKVREQKSETRTKRRTGPGGIYIPPPSQWFK